MSRNIEKQPPPGSPEAQKRGCVCSPNQNRNGAGIQSGKRVQFFTLYWCPVHGIEAMIGALRSHERPDPDNSGRRT